MSRTNEPALTEEIDDAPDIDATVDGDAIERADVEGEDSDIDEGALSDVPEALSVMIDDDLEEMNLGQPADPFDRIAVGKSERPFHGEQPPERDEDEL